jgi:hypothetical protein
MPRAFNKECGVGSTAEWSAPDDSLSERMAIVDEDDALRL